MKETRKKNILFKTILSFNPSTAYSQIESADYQTGNQHFVNLSANCFYAAFALATIALKASGWFIAKSANTLRLISIPALCKAPINLE